MDTVAVTAVTQMSATTYILKVNIF